MELSRSATIILHLPTRPGSKVPETRQDPLVDFLNSDGWRPVFSTFAPSRYDRTPARDVEFSLKLSPVAKTYSITESWIDPNDKPDPLEVETRPRTTTVTGKALDIRSVPPKESEYRASQFEEHGTGKSWEVIAWGKEGQLESWMVDDGSGWIGDGSGEVRPDWRSSYVVVYHHPPKGETAQLEVWSKGRLTQETFKKVKMALKETADEELVGLGLRLYSRA